MNSRGLRRLAVLGMAAALLAGASACGADDEGAAPAPSGPATVKSYAKSVAGVVEASQAFLAGLDDDGRAEAQLEFTEENAVGWSVRPCGSACRTGVELGALDAHQLAAAKSVLKTALGGESGTGYERIEEILLADDRLDALRTSSPPRGGPSTVPSGGPSSEPGSYGSGRYFLAFLGEPTAEGTWQLQFTGHQVAVHMTYEGGDVTSASPFFVGVEPAGWTDDGNAKHEPLGDMKKALLAMTGSLNAGAKAKARLGETFTDVLVGPQADGQFPAAKQGLAVGSLSAAQKKLVLAAIEPWVAGADDATAAALLAIYETELNKTYVGWSGTPGLTRPGDYVRIDGPSVWIEFVCQKGALVANQVRYQTVYRDHTRDYGGDFTFS